MPGAIWSVDPNNPEEAANAIIEWITKHKNDPETAYDKWMRDMIEAREYPIACLRPSYKKKNNK